MNDLGGVLLYVYLIIAQIYGIISFVNICKDWDSILGIIFLGPILAEIQGLLWIFLIW